MNSAACRVSPWKLPAFGTSGIAWFASGYSDVILARWPLEPGADPAAWGSKIGEGLAQWKPKSRHEGADEFVEIFDLDTFDDDLARIERLDAMIDRTIKRLMQVKTMKQMYRRLEPKLINLPAVKTTLAQNGAEHHSTQ
jgi:hypothetical protein